MKYLHGQQFGQKFGREVKSLLENTGITNLWLQQDRVWASLQSIQPTHNE